MGLGFVATKFTFGILWPPFWLGARRRGAWAAGALGVTAVVFGAALAAGLPVWRPLFGESAELGFGPSLWRLPVVFTPLILGRWSGLLLAAALVALWIWCARAGRAAGPDGWLVLTGPLFLLLSPKVMPMYITPFWPLAAWWLARWDDPVDLGLAALLNFLLGVWWYFDAGGLQGMFGPVIRAAVGGRDAGHPAPLPAPDAPGGAAGAPPACVIH